MAVIFLHIGAQKTGSTTIQKVLYDNKSILKKENIHYAEVLPDDGNKVSHYNSVRGFFSNNATEQERTKRFLSQFDDKNKNYVISAENLSNWPVASQTEEVSAHDYELQKSRIIKKIKDSLSDHDVKVILFTRNRLDYLKSLFKQHLKVNYEISRSIDHSLYKFLARELIRSDFGFEAGLWERYFEHVEIVDYDKHKNGSLLKRFSDAIELKIELSATNDQNISPDWIHLEKRRIKMSYGANLEVFDFQKAEAFNANAEKYVSNVIRAKIQ